MNRRNFIALSSVSVASSAFALETTLKCNSTPLSWYIPEYLHSAPNNLTLKVRDTDSALGRYNKHNNIKEINIEDVVKYHGHLCDGVVRAFLQLYVGLSKLFPDGIIDRTDLVGVSKNSPCLVDTLTYLSGAKINFRTLRIDSSVGAAHILQRSSTRETYKVSLRKKFNSSNLEEAEKVIRIKQKNGEKVLSQEIDKAEKYANDFIYTMLHTPLEELVKVKKLDNYVFHVNSSIEAFGKRSDIVNKNVPH